MGASRLHGGRYLASRLRGKLTGALLFAGASMLVPAVVAAQGEPWQDRRYAPENAAASPLGPSPELAQTTPERSYAIPAGPLAPALNRFADESGLQLIYGAEATQNTRTGGVAGTYAPEEALRRLLKSTGLSYRFTNANTVTVERSGVRENLGNNAIELEPVTVTAARFGTAVSDVPASITVLDEAEIEAQPTFKRDPMSAVAKTIPGASLNLSGDRPRIRGREASFRINGVEINNKALPTDFALLDVAPNSFSSVEVVRGADATYGIGATGAVVNFLSAEPTGGPLTATSTAGFSTQPTDFANSFSPRLSQRLGGTAGSVDFDATVNFIHGRNVFSPDGQRLPADPPYFDANTINFSGAAVHHIDAAQRLKTTQYFTRIDGRGEIEAKTEGNAAEGIEAETGLIPSIPGVTFDDNDRHLYVGTLAYQNDDLFGSLFDLTAYYHERESRTEPIVFDPTFFFQTRGRNESYGLRSSVETPLAFLPGRMDNTTVTWGADYGRFKFTPFVDNASPNVAGEDPEHTHDTIGLFGQLEIPASDALTLSGGVRWEYQDISLTSSPNRTFGGGPFEGGSTSFDAFLFNAGAVYWVTEEINTFASFKQALDVLDFGRAQSTVDRFDQLKPEPTTTDQYEIGVRGDWKRLQGSVAAFYSNSKLGQRFDDPVVTGGFAIPRREPQKVWGVEIEAAGDLTPELRLGGSFSWSDGIIDVGDDGDWERNVFNTVPGKFSGFVQWAPTEWALGRLIVTHQLARDARANIDTGPIRSVTLVDVHTEFQIGPGRLNLSVENLFNETAFSQETFVDRDTALPFPGTMFFAAYSYEW